jgi:tRNA (guanine37-N1)-methyltransferase
MKINVLTLFPEMFTPVTEASILGRAVDKGILDINLVNIRDYTLDKHRKTDDTPFGGGPGMVMSAQPIFDALRSLGASAARVIYMSPRGRILDQQKIEELAAAPELTILCGHYEGVDQRVLDAWNMEEISIGDYILTGGELAAMVLIDSVSRFIPEVLGSEESATEESIYSGLLEFDQYTKPREYEGRAVPEVLFGGNHQEIHLWQYERSLALTKERRPDLFAAYLAKLGITGSAQVNPTPSNTTTGSAQVSPIQNNPTTGNARGVRITLGKHDAPSLTKQEKRILEKILNDE